MTFGTYHVLNYRDDHVLFVAESPRFKLSGRNGPVETRSCDQPSGVKIVVFANSIFDQATLTRGNRTKKKRTSTGLRDRSQLFLPVASFDMISFTASLS